MRRLIPHLDSGASETRLDEEGSIHVEIKVDKTKKDYYSILKIQVIKLQVILTHPSRLPQPSSFMFCDHLFLIPIFL